MGSWNNWAQLATGDQGLTYGIQSQAADWQMQQMQAPVFYTPEQVQMLYRQLGMYPRRAVSPQPLTNFSAYEQRHQEVVATQSEDEDMREGFTGMLNTFLVGCDPEFVALDGKGAQMNLAAHFRADGEVGYDHGGRVGEFRPEPTRGTYALTKRLQRLIKSPGVERLGASKLRAGARVNRDTLGGHVHLGFSTSKCAAPIVSALDRVTQVLESLDILPAAESKGRRDTGNYGRFSDIRDSQGHVEYRTMASWLTDPKIAFLCLTAAKLAASVPKETLEALPANAGFNHLVEWLRHCKDVNARRALERVLGLGHKAIVVYPDVDFRERWRELGL